MRWLGGAEVVTYHLCTICTEGVVSSLSGSRLISFMMFESLTGSSCLRKTKEVFSQALMDPEPETRTRLISRPPFFNTEYSYCLHSYKSSSCFELLDVKMSGWRQQQSFTESSDISDPNHKHPKPSDDDFIHKMKHLQPPLCSAEWINVSLGKNTSVCGSAVNSSASHSINY